MKAILCALLSILFATLIPDAMPYLKWVGGAYLLYLAVSILLSTRKKNHVQENASESGSSTFRSGILLQCLNMKSWLSLLTLFSVYITVHTTSFFAISMWILIAICVMFISTAFWSLFGKVTKRIYERYKLAFNILMAAALVYCSITAVL